MPSVVLLFAGQGAQKIGMGTDLVTASPAARALWEQANDIVGFDLTSVITAGPMEQLTRTSYCQPALYLHGLMVLAALRERVPSLSITACAGLSLGEFTAHAAAETFSFADGLRLVAARGRFMDEACAATKGAMAAMIGGEEDAVKKLAAACDVDVANFNAPGQIVLSGSESGIAEAIGQAKSHGIRIAKALTVAGAYHSRLMKSAQDQLAAELAPLTLRAPIVPVISNVTAESVSDPATIKDCLTRQVTGSVRWSESMQRLCAEGSKLFLELGPGGVLAGLMSRIDKNATVNSIEDLTSLESALAQLG